MTLDELAKEARALYWKAEAALGDTEYGCLVEKDVLREIYEWLSNFPDELDKTS